jgi:hypothetical protein
LKNDEKSVSVDSPVSAKDKLNSSRRERLLLNMEKSVNTKGKQSPSFSFPVEGRSGGPSLESDFTPTEDRDTKDQIEFNPVSQFPNWGAQEYSYIDSPTEKDCRDEGALLATSAENDTSGHSNKGRNTNQKQSQESPKWNKQQTLPVQDMSHLIASQYEPIPYSALTSDRRLQRFLHSRSSHRRVATCSVLDLENGQAIELFAQCYQLQDKFV